MRTFIEIVIGCLAGLGAAAVIVYFLAAVASFALKAA